MDRTNLTVYPFPDELPPDTSSTCDPSEACLYSDNYSPDVDSDDSTKKESSALNIKYPSTKKDHTAKDTTVISPSATAYAIYIVAVSEAITNSEVNPPPIQYE